MSASVALRAFLASVFQRGYTFRRESAWGKTGALPLADFRRRRKTTVIPFVFGSGWIAVLLSLLLGILGLFLVGLGITITTGAPLIKSGGRQVALGVLASTLTFGLGWLVGGRLG